MRCNFCHLTKKGMYKGSRNLKVEEILSQISETIAYKQMPLGDKMYLISFMSMGEPLLNIGNVIEACYILKHTDLATHHGFSPETKFKFDISTVFPRNRSLDVIPTDLGIRVFYSLHSMVESTRKELMPLAEPVSYAFNELVKYHKRTGIKPVIHYTFIDGVNDSDEEVDSILELMTRPEHKDFSFRVLRYNPSDDDTNIESRRLLEVVGRLEDHFYVKMHRSPGYDIKAACGQFICDK